jgi:hypothetical protein
LAKAGGRENFILSGPQQAVARFAAKNQMNKGTKSTNRGLYPKARSMRRRVIAWIARNEPHPGQYKPVNNRQGHIGINVVSAGSRKARLATPMTVKAQYAPESIRRLLLLGSVNPSDNDYNQVNDGEHDADDRGSY